MEMTWLFITMISLVLQCQGQPTNTPQCADTASGNLACTSLELYQKIERLEQQLYKEREDRVKEDTLLKEKLQPKLQVYGPYGGDGGTDFSDWGSFRQGGHITAIDICHSGKPNPINCLWFTYGSTKGPKHGFPKGQCQHFKLNSGESIVGIDGDLELYFSGVPILCRIVFHTSTGRTIGPFGYSGSSTFTFRSNNQPVVFISGRGGEFIDNIQFHVLLN